MDVHTPIQSSAIMFRESTYRSVAYAIYFSKFSEPNKLIITETDAATVLPTVQMADGTIQGGRCYRFCAFGVQAHGVMAVRTF
jgi:hypothetical protein